MQTEGKSGVATLSGRSAGSGRGGGGAHSQAETRHALAHDTTGARPAVDAQAHLRGVHTCSCAFVHVNIALMYKGESGGEFMCCLWAAQQPCWTPCSCLWPVHALLSDQDLIGQGKPSFRVLLPLHHNPTHINAPRKGGARSTRQSTCGVCMWPRSQCGPEVTQRHASSWPGYGPH